MIDGEKNIDSFNIYVTVKSCNKKFWYLCTVQREADPKISFIYTTRDYSFAEY